MEKEETHRQDAGVWRASELASGGGEGLAGNGSALLQCIRTRCWAPRRKDPSVMSEGTESAGERSEEPGLVSASERRRSGAADLHLPAAAPPHPPPSSAPPHLSLSPRTLPPGSANSAILCAEAPPKPPFCSERGRSQWEPEPARPTCHCSSTPKDHLLGGRHARSKHTPMSRDGQTRRQLMKRDCVLVGRPASYHLSP